MNILHKKTRSIISFLFNIILSLLISVSSIYLFTLIFDKCTFLYDIYIRASNLSESVGLSNDTLNNNYKFLTDFIVTPFNKQLNLPNFSISDTAMIHFYDVKNIFSVLLFITLITAVVLSSYIVLSLLLKKRISIAFIKAVPIELLSFCAIVSVSFMINFQKCFILFHKLLFKNDYWLFDPEIDTVINILPGNFFMMAAIAILLCLVIESITIILLLKKFRSVNYKKRLNIYNEL